jgi:hypothetical protein
MPTLTHSAAGAWTQAIPLRDARRAAMPAAASFDNNRRNPWPAASRLTSADFCAWPAKTTVDDQSSTSWAATGKAVPTSTRATHGAATTADQDGAAPWGRYATRRHADIVAVWLPAQVADQAARAPWAAVAARLRNTIRARHPHATHADEGARGPWGAGGRALDPGWLIPHEPDDELAPGQTIITPTLRSYIVVNDISLVRISNSLALPAISLSISADVDSWTYSWSASLPGDKLDDVMPAAPGAPSEFEATINGFAHRLIAERITLDRSHAKPRVQVSGRGIAALLADPYAASEARDNTAAARNAAQLCDDALLINGVPASGWTIDFNLTDWLVPAGAWVTLGAPMDAISGIAAAAGGYVRPHRTDKTLHIEPRYAAAPWDWPLETPAYELPIAATTKVGVEWRENPPYNAVYVAGTGPGAILARVKRAGPAGDAGAPLVTDPLITHADAARQRGTAILGAAGSGQTITLETPVLPAIGPYPVGALVRFVDGATTRLGIVRSCRISAALPRVRQTVELECHD